MIGLVEFAFRPFCHVHIDQPRLSRDLMALKVINVGAKDLSGSILLDVDDCLAERCNTVSIKHAGEVDRAD